MSVSPLRGVIPPVCTPFLPGFDIDRVSLARLVHHLLDAGVDGIFALGSTSEVAFLPDAQRRAVVETIVEETNGAVPVVAGVIDMTTLRVAEHVRAALDAGADGIVATAPFYTRTHPAEIAVHFREIKRVCGDAPLFAYNIPPCVNGTVLSPKLILDLASEGVLAGLKDSSGDDAAIRRVIRGKRARRLEDFAVLTGSELTVDSILFAGADGVVPGLGNVDPAGYVRLFQLVQDGDVAAARAEQERLFTLFDLVEVGSAARMGRGSSALGAFKAALQLQGIIESARTAPPAIPLSPAEHEAVRGFLKVAGLPAGAVA